MDELMWYSHKSIQSMARAFWREMDLAALNSEQVRATLADLLFRDETGTYWTPAPRGEGWYRHGPEGWRADPSPPQPLEGPAAMAMWAPDSPESGPEAEPVETAPNPTAFIEDVVQRARRAYVQGEITSLAAQVLISDHYLLDDQDRFWTVGIHTGTWHSFEEGRWHAGEGPPDPERLVEADTSEAQDQVAQMILDFLSASEGQPPEAVAPPWNPPSAYPEPVVQCPACGHVDVGQRDKCRHCEATWPDRPVSQDLRTRFCTQCGHEQPRRLRFCTQCGHRFKKVKSGR